MRFGIVGFGRMGANLVREARSHGQEVVGLDPPAPTPPPPWATRD